LEVLDNPKRVVAQLPVSAVAGLLDAGAEIAVLRRFVLVEAAKGDYADDGGVTTMAICSGTHRFGENNTNVPIPEGGLDAERDCHLRSTSICYRHVHRCSLRGQASLQE